MGIAIRGVIHLLLLFLFVALAFLTLLIDPPFLFLFVALAVLTLFVYLCVRAPINIHQAEYDAWVAYQSSLKALRLDPANADLKLKALDLGWAFMNMPRGIFPAMWNQRYFGIPQWRWNEMLTGDSGRLYTEVEIANDIYAACAGAAPRHEDAASDHVRSIAERLATIDELMIDRAEYEERRRKILDEL